MALTLAESLKEARSLPIFNGSDEYALSNFLRDVQTVLELTPAEHTAVLQKVLVNRVQGKALSVLESLINPTWDQILHKLKEEFGVKRSFFNLRCDALNIRASNYEELYGKLNNILSEMNKKYCLQPDPLNVPENNELIIFDIYINYLPINIKSLLIQNRIKSISAAHSFFIENNIMHDIVIVNLKPAFNQQSNPYINYRNNNSQLQNRNSNNSNQHQNSVNTRNNYSNRNPNNQYSSNNNSNNRYQNNYVQNSPRFRNNNYNRNYNTPVTHHPIEPMEIDHMQISSNNEKVNFPIAASNHFYQ